MHQKKLKDIKKELELKKQKKKPLVDKDEEGLQLRVLANKLRSHEFVDGEKIIEI